MKFNFAVVIPMANEKEDFHPFVSSLIQVLNMLECGKIYFIVDNVSKDNTLELCEKLSLTDKRFVTVWAPECKNVVDAYIKGYKTALLNRHNFIIEMDAGLSHDPKALPMFFKSIKRGK